MDLLTPFRPAAYKTLRSVLGLGMREHRIRNLEFHSGLGEHAWLLYGLVRSQQPKVCVEIGSARGKSACFISRALEDNGGEGKLYAIDPHTQTQWNDHESVNSYDIMKQNLEAFGVSHRVEIVREYSGNAARNWNKPIDMLFIDGDHSYEGCKADWDLFSPHVSQFGVVIFHDTIWEVGQVEEKYRRSDMGVPKFTDELRRQGYPVITIPTFCGLSIVQPTRGGVDLLNKDAAR
jgi:predicted O-methyltransferase YrrM